MPGAAIVTSGARCCMFLHGQVQFLLSLSDGTIAYVSVQGRNKHSLLRCHSWKPLFCVWSRPKRSTACYSRIYMYLTGKPRPLVSIWLFIVYEGGNDRCQTHVKWAWLVDLPSSRSRPVIAPLPVTRTLVMCDGVRCAAARP